MKQATMDRIQLVIDKKLQREIERWRRKQAELPSRSAAIRALVRKGLENEK